MDLWVDIATAATALNVLLLSGLGCVWGKNVFEFRSKHTLGLLVFAGFLLCENVLVLYYYLFDPALSAW